MADLLAVAFHSRFFFHDDLIYQLCWCTFSGKNPSQINTSELCLERFEDRYEIQNEKNIIFHKGVKTIDGFNGPVDLMILELISLALFLKLGSLEYRFLKHKNIFPICH